MLNYKKIEKVMSDRKMAKAQLCNRTKIARTTLDAILNGSDAKISTIESLATALGVPISYFFDEDVPPSKEVRQSSHGDNSPNVYGDGNQVNVPPHGDTERLQERIRHLEEMVAEKEKMILEKERVIRLYETVMGKK